MVSAENILYTYVPTNDRFKKANEKTACTSDFQIGYFATYSFDSGNDVIHLSFFKTDYQSILVEKNYDQSDTYGDSAITICLYPYVGDSVYAAFGTVYRSDSYSDPTYQLYLYELDSSLNLVNSYSVRITYSTVDNVNSYGYRIKIGITYCGEPIVVLIDQLDDVSLTYTGEEAVCIVWRPTTSQYAVARIYRESANNYGPDTLEFICTDAYLFLLTNFGTENWIIRYDIANNALDVLGKLSGITFDGEGESYPELYSFDGEKIQYDNIYRDTTNNLIRIGRYEIDTSTLTRNAIMEKTYSYSKAHLMGYDINNKYFYAFINDSVYRFWITSSINEDIVSGYSWLSQYDDIWDGYGVLTVYNYSSSEWYYLGDRPFYIEFNNESSSGETIITTKEVGITTNDLNRFLIGFCIIGISFLAHPIIGLVCLGGLALSGYFGSYGFIVILAVLLFIYIMFKSRLGGGGEI